MVTKPPIFVYILITKGYHMKALFELTAIAFIAFSLYASLSFLQLPIWLIGLACALWKLYKCGEVLSAVETERKEIAFKSKLFNDTLQHIQENFDAETTDTINEFIKSHGAELAEKMKG